MNVRRVDLEPVAERMLGLQKGIDRLEGDGRATLGVHDHWIGVGPDGGATDEQEEREQKEWFHSCLLVFWPK